MNITCDCGNSDNVGKLGGQDDRRRGRRSQDMQFSVVVLSQIKVESMIGNPLMPDEVRDSMKSSGQQGSLALDVAAIIGQANMYSNPKLLRNTCGNTINNM
jgi:hypothetical protein